MHHIFRKLFKKHIGIAALCILFSLLFAASFAFSSTSLSKLLEVVENPVPDPIVKLTKDVLFILSAFAITAILFGIKQLFVAKYKFRMNNDMRAEITSKIVNTPYDNFDNKNSGNYISWYTNDVSQLEKLSFSGIIDVIDSGAQLVASFVAMTILNQWLGLVAFGFLLFSIAIPQLTNVLLIKAQKRLTESDEKLTEDVRDAVGGFRVLFITNKINKFREIMNLASSERELASLHYNRIFALVQSIGVLVSIISQTGMIVVTLYFALSGLTALGSTFAIASLSGMLFNGVGQFIQDFMRFKSAKAIYNKFEYEIPEDGDMRLDTLKNIELSDVGMQYDDKTVLTGFSKAFDASKKYALIGESGSGKTTLLKIIIGLLQPTSGEVKLNNHRFDDVNRASFYSQLAYIDQNVYLFKGSIRDNITLWKDVDAKVLDEVLEKAKLKAFIDRLPNGLDTYLDESGKNISGGERQRIAIARALVNESKLLIIDEATSQLDPENARAIENQLLDQKDFGIIMINHHFEPEVLERFDDVVELYVIQQPTNPLEQGTPATTTVPTKA